jgi:hypothetical protein
LQNRVGIRMHALPSPHCLPTIPLLTVTLRAPTPCHTHSHMPHGTIGVCKGWNEQGIEYLPLSRKFLCLVMQKSGRSFFNNILRSCESQWNKAEGPTNTSSLMEKIIKGIRFKSNNAGICVRSINNGTINTTLHRYIKR